MMPNRRTHHRGPMQLNERQLGRKRVRWCKERGSYDGVSSMVYNLHGLHG